MLSSGLLPCLPPPSIVCVCLWERAEATWRPLGARAVTLCDVLHCSPHGSSVLRCNCPITARLYPLAYFFPFQPLMAIHFSLCIANCFCLDSAYKWEHALFFLSCLVDFSVWLFSVFFVEDCIWNRSFGEWSDTYKNYNFTFSWMPNCRW